MFQKEYFLTHFQLKYKNNFIQNGNDVFFVVKKIIFNVRAPCLVGSFLKFLSKPQLFWIEKSLGFEIKVIKFITKK